MRVLRTAVNLVSSVFGCGHGRMSRPFTIGGQSYLVCLNCGRKVFYSPTEMRRLSAREARHARREIAARQSTPDKPTIAA